MKELKVFLNFNKIIMANFAKTSLSSNFRVVR